MLRLTYRDPDLTQAYEHTVPDEADADLELLYLAGKAHELDPSGNKAYLSDDVRLGELARAYGKAETVHGV